jgi:hypothetical protein
VLNKCFSKWKQEVSTKFGSAHGCAVRTGALRSGWAVQDKKMARAAFLLVTFLWLFKEHDSLELRNCVSVSHHLHAVKGETPTIKFKPSVYKRRLTNNRCVVSINTRSVETSDSPSRAELQQIKLNQKP